ncbi:unnamed protein product [Protopolystoma xenopodis]|uniref:Uncharacterized protein n=1 Tax=Protopolystoma xenopodis TaxID=117903 RepID=A0A448WK31_9PLAT|nr:unnamed protein product [Protopolystoma xenopodis]
MASGYDYVRHMTDESSTQSDRGHRTVSRGFLRTIKQINIHGNSSAVSGGTNLRITSTRLLKRNEIDFVYRLGNVFRYFKEHQILQKYGFKKIRNDDTHCTDGTRNQLEIDRKTG